MINFLTIVALIAVCLGILIIGMRVLAILDSIGHYFEIKTWREHERKGKR